MSFAGRGGSNPPSDTNRTYTSEIRFNQHSSLARLVGEGQSKALVESGLLCRISGLENEIPNDFDHRSEVALGERWHWATSREFILGRPPVGLDLADPPGDDGGVCSGLEGLPVAGESGVTVREGPLRDLLPTVFLQRRLLSLRECATRLFQPVRLEDPWANPRSGGQIHR